MRTGMVLKRVMVGQHQGMRDERYIFRKADGLMSEAECDFL